MFKLGRSRWRQATTTGLTLQSLQPFLGSSPKRSRASTPSPESKSKSRVTTPTGSNVAAGGQLPGHVQPQALAQSPSSGMPRSPSAYASFATSEQARLLRRRQEYRKKRHRSISPKKLVNAMAALGAALSGNTSPDSKANAVISESLSIDYEISIENEHEVYESSNKLLSYPYVLV